MVSISEPYSTALAVPTRMNQLPDKEHIITARRSPDGSFRFNVRISHIIEQTLLRSLNRPNFRKSTIRVIDESDLDSDEETSFSTELDHSMESKESTSLLPVKLKRRWAGDSYSEQSTSQPSPDSSKGTSALRICTGVETHSNNNNNNHKNSNTIINNETRIILKANTWDEPPSKKSANIGELLSPIPPSWLDRGITKAEKRQFQNSIANASVCPYQRKPVSKSKDKLTWSQLKSTETAQPSTSRGETVMGPPPAHQKQRTGQWQRPSVSRWNSASSHTGHMDMSAHLAMVTRHPHLSEEQLAYMLSAIENELPSQRPTLRLNESSDVKYRDLVGAVIERHLSDDGEPASPSMLSL